MSKPKPMAAMIRISHCVRLSEEEVARGDEDTEDSTKRGRAQHRRLNSCLNNRLGEDYSRVPQRDGASRSSNSFRSSSLTSFFFRALLRAGASAAKSFESSRRRSCGVRSLEADGPKILSLS